MKFTRENHWGFTANPANRRIVIDDGNPHWEHGCLMYHGLASLAPHSHTKYWNRWKNPDLQSCVRIMAAATYMAEFALEHDDGSWNGAESGDYLYKEVLAAR